MSSNLHEILTNLVETAHLDPIAESSLRTLMLQNTSDASAFGITSDTAEVAARDRVRLLRSAYADLSQLCQQTLHLEPFPFTTLWHLWLPLALQLATLRQQLGRPLVQGILGGQGTGKTTLGAILTLLLRHLGYNALSWSIDDLYKSYVDRQRLRAQDPRLIWRGPPGTHDVELGIEVLDRLRQATPNQVIAIPRFDKSLHQGAGDRTHPDWVQNIDIVLFEGWFVGVRPVEATVFAQAPAPILTEVDRAFARDCNSRLCAYLPLWERLDRLMVLYLPDYRWSKDWRQHAEHQMIAQGKPGMTDAEVDAFVDYFWRSLHPQLFIDPLINNPLLVNLVVEIGIDHMPIRIYRPGT